MKITDIQCIHVQIPKVSTNIIGGSVSYEGNPYRDEEPEHMNQFVGSVPHFGHSCSGIVKVYTDEGIVGIGEAATETTRCEIDRIRDNLIGCDVYDIIYNSNYTMQGRGNTLRVFTKHIRLPRTKEQSAVEFALWDIIGKKAGLPVYKLLGGKVREKAPVTLFLGERPIDDCIADIDKAMKNGIMTVKIKVGCNDKRDVDLIREIRRQFGYDLAIRIDPNAAWTVPESIRILKRMEPFHLQYAEGFLKANEKYSFRKVREATGVPVCICEQFNGYNEMTSQEALTQVCDLIRMKAFDVLSVDPSRTGGLLGFQKLCAVCEGAGLQVVTHRASTSVSQATWLTGICISPASDLAQDIVPVGQPSGPLYDAANETLFMENGYMRPWDAPGWGLTLNEEVISKYTCAMK